MGWHHSYNGSHHFEDHDIASSSLCLHALGTKVLSVRASFAQGSAFSSSLQFYFWKIDVICVHVLHGQIYCELFLMHWHSGCERQSGVQQGSVANFIEFLADLTRRLKQSLAATLLIYNCGSRPLCNAYVHL